MLPAIRITLLAGRKLAEQRRSCRGTDQSDMSRAYWHNVRRLPSAPRRAAATSTPRRHDDALGAREGAEAERAASGHPVQTAAGGRQQVLRRLRGQRSVGHTSAPLSSPCVCVCVCVQMEWCWAAFLHRCFGEMGWESLWERQHPPQHRGFNVCLHGFQNISSMFCKKKKKRNACCANANGVQSEY